MKPLEAFLRTVTGFPRFRRPDDTGWSSIVSRTSARQFDFREIRTNDCFLHSLSRVVITGSFSER